MKIGFPINERCKYTEIHSQFARANFILVYNTDTDEYIFVDNAASNAQGGAGIKVAQLIIDNNIDAVVLPRCGENAYNVLKEGKVNVYQMMNDNVEENIKALLNKELTLLEDTHPGFHGNAAK